MSSYLNVTNKELKILIVFNLLLNVFFFFEGKTQNYIPNKCNRAVRIKQFEKELPKEICIPNGPYFISHIFESEDVNLDGLNDFIFGWNKDSLIDGDTLFLSIYIQNHDSTFSYFKSFKNLYPIYFKRYDSQYVPKEKKLREIYIKYNREYLLTDLKVDKENIIITMESDATSEFIITYKFNKAINNWEYIKTIDHDFVENTYKPYDLSKKLGPTIDNFTYFIWDE